MKYIFTQSVRNLLFAGLVLPNLVMPIDSEKLTQWVNFGVNSGAQPLGFSSPRTLRVEPDYNLRVDFNAVTPVVIDEQPVKITWAKSNYDLKRAQPVLAQVRSEPEPSLEEKRALVQQIADDKGIDPKLLEAVWQVESGKSWNSAKRSGAGATGPAQFMPGTFRRYGEDYDRDGQVNITDAHDSLAAAANLLIENGLNDGNVRGALLAYNRADWYVKKVLKVAESIQY